jgi:serine phosphatase RsbU (regulator of sigma subunit)
VERVVLRLVEAVVLAELGVEALQRVVQSSVAQSATAIVDILMQDVRSHSQRHLPDDDTSILVLKQRDPTI